MMDMWANQWYGVIIIKSSLEFSIHRWNESRWETIHTSSPVSIYGVQKRKEEIEYVIHHVEEFIMETVL